MKKLANVILATALSATMVLAVDFDSNSNKNNDLIINKSTGVEVVVGLLVIWHLFHGDK